MNIEIIGFALGFWVRLSFLRYSLWSKDLFKHLDLLDTDIPSKNFVCLRDVLKTSSRYVFKTSSKHVFKTSSRRLQRNNFSSPKTSCERSWKRLLGRRKIVTLKTCRRRLQDISWRRLQDVLKTNKCLLRRLQVYVAITYYTLLHQAIRKED